VITFAIGAVLTGLLSLLMQPWYVLSAFSTYIFTWLGTYGTLLGPFDGIAIADYWLVRVLRLDLVALYQNRGRYAARTCARLPPSSSAGSCRWPDSHMLRSTCCGKAAGSSVWSWP
jgi:cytosine/uracil/thiamine/allantoin permease